MKFVFTSYVITPEYESPHAWLERTQSYANIHAALAQNHEVISIEQINYQGEHNKNGVTYQFLKLPRTAIYVAIKLNNHIASLKPDVVVIHGTHFPLQVMHLRLVLGKRVKIIVQHHAELPFNNPIKKYQQQKAGSYIDAYLFASHDMGLDWVRRGNLPSANKIYEVMEVSSVFYPVDERLSKSQLKITGEPVFLWVGRLNENKDPVTAIKAFLKFVTLQPGAKLYMIYHTEGLLPEITQLLNNDDNATAIKLIGKVPHHELLYWYNSADFILSASHYEGSGTAVCEAMSCGCIPIVTDIFSFRMITDNSNCGLLFKPGNEGALLAALKQTMQMDLHQKRELCLNYFMSNLSFDAIARRIEKVVNSL